MRKQGVINNDTPDQCVRVPGSKTAAETGQDDSFEKRAADAGEAALQENDKKKN